MSGREALLAEIEARRRAQAAKKKTGVERIEILAADLSLEPDDTSYNPYDKPSLAKPLDTDRASRYRRRARR